MKLAPALFTLALVAPTAASAQDSAGNGREAVHNAVERARDNRQSADDHVDLIRIADIVRDWEAAVAAKDKAKEKAADLRLQAWLRQELREERREAGQAAAERGQARAERDRSRREARSGGAKDRADLRDDRRDLRDDRRDAREATVEVAVLKKTASELDELAPAFAKGTATAAQYTKKRTLLRSLIRGERREVRQDAQERREDRRERKEDARERREDRRTRRK
ncbi:MAG: hypothetical protein H6730_14895 [Deltaproteobacteria bacterium]|nr:hypothetical protein [Deltaproteobacteria bacterium]